MKSSERLVRYIMFMASVVLMLSVIVPHHHHEDGMPCFAPFATEHSTDSNDGHSEKSHDCGCNGHNAAEYSDVKSHLTDGDIHTYIMPLFAVFDYYDHPDITAFDIFLTRQKYFSDDILKDIWIGDCVVLRAPPAA